MKKITFLFVSLIAFCSAAIANDYQYYVGMDLGVAQHSTKESYREELGDEEGGRLNGLWGSNVGFHPSKKAPSAGLFVGARFNEYFGAEFGFQYDKTIKTDWNGTRTDAFAVVHTDQGHYTMNSKNLYLDALGYYPVANKFELIGLAGIGRLHSKTHFVNAGTTGGGAMNFDKSWSSSKFGLRLGGGVQYKLTDHLNARAMIVAQQGNSIVKHHTSARLGLSYSL